MIRGDDAPIRIGAGANIQDGYGACTSRSKATSAFPASIGEDCRGRPHGAAARLPLEPGAFVGMKACVMDRAVVEAGAMVAAGAVVTPRKVVEAGELWAGTPARFSRAAEAGGTQYMRWVPQHYRELAEEYRGS